MAANDIATSETTEGPVLAIINRRHRALHKKQKRITQMEESISQGKTLNKEQEEVLRSKPAVLVLIEELNKLRDPLSTAVSEEISLATQNLVEILYFGSLLDVKCQSDLDSDSISKLRSLIMSRVDSSLSHKDALDCCIDHAKLWLAKSDKPIESNSNVSYGALREQLKKFMASDYFTTRLDCEQKEVDENCKQDSVATGHTVSTCSKTASIISEELKFFY
ncbi:unnamed protein product [Microthlaspi erraticum]|uniref:Uncharacterized protein n=1 Tax=Microthlaspi erraticum TaxID=1685480 RepID=A0A6D2JGZ9_9BRAS|nr:unnamed protein product [Microthlaspi erraticum]